MTDVQDKFKTKGLVNYSNPIVCNNTDYIKLPTGNTSQRGTATGGEIRYNNESLVVEAYVNGSWIGFGDTSSKVSKTGDSMSGDLTIQKASPRLWLNVVSSGNPEVTCNRDSNNYTTMYNDASHNSIIAGKKSGVSYYVQLDQGGIYSSVYGDYLHNYLALSNHNHAGVYSPINHNHAGVYSPINHNHEGIYAKLTGLETFTGSITTQCDGASLNLYSQSGGGGDPTYDPTINLKYGVGHLTGQIFVQGSNGEFKFRVTDTTGLGSDGIFSILPDGGLWSNKYGTLGSYFALSTHNHDSTYSKIGNSPSCAVGQFIIATGPRIAGGGAYVGDTVSGSGYYVQWSGDRPYLGFSLSGSYKVYGAFDYLETTGTQDCLYLLLRTA